MIRSRIKSNILHEKQTDLGSDLAKAIFIVFHIEEHNYPEILVVYSRTSRKRPPIMSRICGRLREVVAYQRSDHKGGGGGGGV